MQNEFELLPLQQTVDAHDLYGEIVKKMMDRRVLEFNEDVDNAVIENYVLRIINWNIEDAHLQPKYRKPITLIIDSGGGDVFQANALIDAIMTSETPIQAIGIGYVCSASYLIYLAADKRYAFENTTFLQHDGETSIANSSNKAKDTMAFFDDMAVRTKKFVLSRTTMDEEFYDEYYDRELWFYADQGKELGVVHKIIGQDVKLLDVFKD